MMRLVSCRNHLITILIFTKTAPISTAIHHIASNKSRVAMDDSKRSLDDSFDSDRLTSLRPSFGDGGGRIGTPSKPKFRATFISSQAHATTRATTTKTRRTTFALKSLKNPNSNESKCQYTESRQELEECVANVESILNCPEIMDLLDDAQLSAIEKLRERINLCQQSIGHVGESDEGSAMLVPSSVMNDLDNPNNQFIATSYGGLKLPEKKAPRARFRSLGRLVSNSIKDIDYFLPEEWNVLSHEKQMRLADLLSLENLERWDFNILDVLECVKNDDSTSSPNILVIVGWAIIASPDSQRVMASSLGRGEEFDKASTESDGYNFSTSLGLKPSILTSFLRALEAEYVWENKYHNSIHAADVLQSLHSLIRMGRGGMSDTLNSLELYSMLLAAAAHDVGHPGTNNLYQINAKTDLAIIYNDKSCLENMHAAKTFQILRGSTDEDCVDVFQSLSKAKSKMVRTRMIQAILATDMAHHFSSVSFIENICAQMEAEGMDWSDIERSDDSDIIKDILNFMIHLADISNPAKMRKVSCYWADCALGEFFAQGDLESKQDLPVSPLCDRNTTILATSQRDFIRYCVLPAFEVLGDIIPLVDEQVVPKIIDNLNYWESMC